MSNPSHDVIVIGAGISGLSCAQELSIKHPNINLAILEASDRIGGRVHSIKTTDGTTLELGAQYIHGTVGNELYDYMVAKGLLASSDKHHNTCENEGLVTCYPKEFSLYDENDLENAFLKGAHYLEAFQKHEITEEEMKVHKTYGGYMVHCFKQTLDLYKDDDFMYQILKSVFLEWISTEHMLSNTPSIFDLDIQGFRSYIDLEGDPHLVVSDICKNGFDDVIKSMRDDIPFDCFHFNHKVSNIGKKVVDGRSKIVVTCSNGQFYLADNVVLTVSLGVLKNFLKDNVFSFQLPPAKIAAIENLGYGNLVKIFFKFSIPIDKEISFFQFYPSSMKNSFLSFDKNNVADLTFERIGDTDWWLSWYVGCCDSDYEFKSNPKIYLNKLIKCFSDMYISFPDNSVIEDSIIVSDWSKDELFCGSYMYPKPGTNSADILNLAAPVKFGEASLLFAGEATCVNFFSSTHGAFISGRREAGNIKFSNKQLA